MQTLSPAQIHNQIELNVAQRWNDGGIHSLLFNGRSTDVCSICSLMHYLRLLGAWRADATRREVARRGWLVMSYVELSTAKNAHQSTGYW